MGVKIRNRDGKLYVFVNHNGHRKSKCVGSSRAAAEQVKRVLEAKLALGDIGIFAKEASMPMFDGYGNQWLRDYARIECKTSTADGYERVLRQYLRPRFGTKRLDEIRRDDIKAMISDLISRDLSRNTIRNALCVIRGMFNQAIESGLLDTNPATDDSPAPQRRPIRRGPHSQRVRPKRSWARQTMSVKSTTLYF
jgi:hypothetical protein